MINYFGIGPGRKARFSKNWNLVDLILSISNGSNFIGSSVFGNVTFYLPAESFIKCIFVLKMFFAPKGLFV